MEDIFIILLLLAGICSLLGTIMIGGICYGIFRDYSYKKWIEEETGTPISLIGDTKWSNTNGNFTTNLTFDNNGIIIGIIHPDKIIRGRYNEKNGRILFVYPDIEGIETKIQKARISMINFNGSLQLIINIHDDALMLQEFKESP